ncbi:unnamed protein product, partial [Polarella glacialis]
RCDELRLAVLQFPRRPLDRTEKSKNGRSSAHAGSTWTRSSTRLRRLKRRRLETLGARQKLRAEAARPSQLPRPSCRLSTTSWLPLRVKSASRTPVSRSKPQSSGHSCSNWRQRLSRCDPLQRRCIRSAARRFSESTASRMQVHQELESQLQGLEGELQERLNEQSEVTAETRASEQASAAAELASAEAEGRTQELSAELNELQAEGGLSDDEDSRLQGGVSRRAALGDIQEVWRLEVELEEASSKARELRKAVEALQKQRAPATVPASSIAPLPGVPSSAKSARSLAARLAAAKAVYQRGAVVSPQSPRRHLQPSSPEKATSPPCQVCPLVAENRVLLGEIEELRRASEAGLPKLPPAPPAALTAMLSQSHVRLRGA